MLLAWITDPHFNFLKDFQFKKFCEKVVYNKPDAIVLTGDISEAPTFEIHMRLMEKYTGGIPIYFVAGNHDYYKGSVSELRKVLKKKFGKNSISQWLGNVDYISLTDEVGLVGHDGWYDGGYSNYYDSNLEMSDYRLIKELMGGPFHRVDQYNTIKRLSQESANYVSEAMRKGFEKHKQLYVATHVPPFRENSRAPDGSLSNKNWLPCFSSKFMGDTILNRMAQYSKDYTATVLCGHTHTYWEHTVNDQIKCITGGAVYGNPSICGYFIL